MLYKIERGIPIPEIRRARRSKEVITMEHMEVGDSFAVEPARVNSVRCAVRDLKPKKFVVRKLPGGGGWRVWRTE